MVTRDVLFVGFLRYRQGTIQPALMFCINSRSLNRLLIHENIMFTHGYIFGESFDIHIYSRFTSIIKDTDRGASPVRIATDQTFTISSKEMPWVGSVNFRCSIPSCTLTTSGASQYSRPERAMMAERWPSFG